MMLKFLNYAERVCNCSRAPVSVTQGKGACVSLQHVLQVGVLVRQAVAGIPDSTGMAEPKQCLY